MSTNKLERESDRELEYRIKAVMLVKFHQLTTWPDKPLVINGGNDKIHTIGRSFASAIAKKIIKIFKSPPLFGVGINKQQIVICVIGKNPFSEKAREVFSVASKGNVKYKFINTEILPDRYCHIVFIAKNKSGDVDEILRKLDSTPTLTVSEIPGFARQGGDVELFLFGKPPVTRQIVNEHSILEKGLTLRPEIYKEKSVKFIRNKRKCVRNEKVLLAPLVPKMH